MNVTEFRTAFSRITSQGWLTFEEALLLVDYASRTSGPIIEIGSYMGRSAMLLAHLRRSLTCIDPWDDHFHDSLKGDAIYDRFIDNICSLPDNLGHYVLPTREYIEYWTPTPAGFVYCDGDHSYVGTVNQISKALQCGPDFIAVHDVADTGGGRIVKDAALASLGMWIERVGTLAVWRNLT